MIDIDYGCYEGDPASLEISNHVHRVIGNIYENPELMKKGK